MERGLALGWINLVSPRRKGFGCAKFRHGLLDQAVCPGHGRGRCQRMAAVCPIKTRDLHGVVVAVMGGRQIGGPVGFRQHDVREQADRLSRCRLTFHVQQGGRAGLINQNIVDAAMFVDGSAHQESLFVETARLSETFFDQLKRHPVPLEEAAIRAISNNSQALDIYCWLAYRLHVLPSARTVSWPALYAQFGSSYNKLKHFKERFIESLKVAIAVYRYADIEVNEKGLILHPSRPPVAPRPVALQRPRLIDPA